MAGVMSFPRLTISMIVLLTGFFLIMSFGLVHTYHWTPYPVELLDTQNRTLSQDSPICRLNVTMASPFVTITSLQTNSTPVTLVVRGPTQVQFNATNITSLIMVPLHVARVEADLWVEVIRQESDANITIAIVFQTGATVPPPPSAPPPFFNLAPIIGAVLLVFALGMLFLTTSRFNYHRNENIILIAAILLLCIGTSFCYPLLKGQVQGDFIPVYTAVTLPDENFSYVLNETDPLASLEISSLYPEEGIVTNYRVHSILSDNYPLVLRISDDIESEIILEEESHNSNWWLTIPADLVNSTIISFERVDSVTIVDLSVMRNCLTLQTREDIKPPTLYFIFGLTLIIVGIALTVRVDLASKLEDQKILGTPPAIE